MATKTDPNELFEMAVKNFEAAMKAGAKLQEETTKVWANLLTKPGAPEEWQDKFREMVEEAIPTAKANADEALSLMEMNYKKSMELLQQALEIAQSESISDAQAKTQDFFSNSLTAMRENAQAVIQANSKVVDTWTEFVRKSNDEVNA